MHLAILEDMFHIINDHGWVPANIVYSAYGPMSFCEALYMACRFDLQDYAESTVYFAKFLGVSGVKGIIAWECEHARTEQQILDIIRKAQNDLQQLVKPG